MKAILFDLDGTLLDTRDLILNSMQYAFCKILGEENLPPDDQLLSMVGIPLNKQMEMFSLEKSEELFKAYLENHSRIQDAMIRDFDGTKEALTALWEKGLRLAVVTSKRHDPAEHCLAHRGLAHYFEFILGADDTIEHKPKPGPLLEAAKLMGLDPHECAYIGDSPYDMLAARAANMFAVGALWGMFTEETLLEAGAEVLISHLSELIELV